MDVVAAAGERARELLAVLHAYAPETAAWLDAGLAQAAPAGGPLARGVFFGLYAGAGRRLRAAAGPAPELSPAERTRLVAVGVERPEAWSLADVARAALLLRACAAVPHGEHVAIATEAFRKGDSAERAALLRSLPLLPSPERFVELAVEACRTHVLDVFAAIACDNPFPARHFPQLNFNQLVIKTLFVELPLARVVGWRDRVNPELVRMASDYEAERRAAGRVVPSDIALIQAAEEPPPP
jgi:hypothetical protein